MNKIATFAAGGAASLAAMAVTIYLAYTFTVSGFEYGLNLGGLLVEEREPSHVEITLSNPTTLDELSRILYERDVIQNPLLFQIENFLQGNTADFQPGTFLVSTDMSAIRLATAMRASAFFTDHRITILEGFTNSDIASTLELGEHMYAEEFLAWLDEAELDGEFFFLRELPQRPNRLQGYLFPDTYMIPANASPQDVAIRQLRRFEEVFDFEKTHRASELGLSMDEVITIASIIERETRISTDPQDRAKFSAIIHNRLRDSLPLNMVSTVSYALDRPSSILTPNDFNTTSPFNTFINHGLPPGPISNPGLASIEAALHPHPGNYLYALLIDIETGEHFFTPYPEEYNRVRAELPY